MWNYSVPFYHTCQNDSCSRQIVEFYEINKFSLKTTPFYKKRPHFIENYPFFIENYPPFIKKNYGPPPERKLQPLIQPL